MAFVGSLITTVKAKTAPFAKSMKKAERATRKLRKQLKSLGVSGVKFGAVLGGVVVGAIALYTVKAFAAIDATKKLADELQIATSDLVSYQLAAGLSGTTTETLNKALQRMARTVGEARTGITTGTKALDDFGISVKELDGLTSAQIFEEFAERISNIEDPMERAAKSALIFGRAGQKLLNFLALGKTGLAAVKAEAEALGLAFDEVDARKVEQANDAILKMQTVAKGLGNTIAISVAPFLTDLADKMGDFIKEAGGIDNIVKNELKNLAIGVAKVLELIKLGEAAWNIFSGTSRIAIATMMTALARAEDQTRSFLRLFDKDIAEKGFIRNLREEFIELGTKDILAAKAAFKDFEEGITSSKVLDFFQNIQDSANKVAEELESATTSQKGFTASAMEAAEAVKAQAKAAAELARDRAKIASEAQRIFDETRTPLEKIEAEIKRIMELFSKGGFEGIEAAFDRKIKELEEQRKKLLDTVGKEVAPEVIEDIAEKFGVKMREAIEEAAPGEKETKGVRAGFQEIDVRNINVSGLNKFNNVDEKQLTEVKKSNDFLQDISRNIVNFGGGVAL